MYLQSVYNKLLRVLQIFYSLRVSHAYLPSNLTKPYLVIVVKNKWYMTIIITGLFLKVQWSQKCLTVCLTENLIIFFSCTTISSVYDLGCLLKVQFCVVSGLLGTLIGNSPRMLAPRSFESVWSGLPHYPLEKLRASWSSSRVVNTLRC